jgi:fatty-acyl-CoA synthase
MGTSLTWITDSIAGQSPAVDPNRPAVAFDDQEPLSWAQLRDAELRYARSLQAAGIGRGDRVAMLLTNSVDYLVFFLALARVGAVAVRLNWRLTAGELQFMLDDSGTKMLLLDAEFADRIEGILGDITVESHVVRGADGSAPEWATPLEHFLGGQGNGEFPELGLDDPLSLMYTSGTTGRPKGAIWTHGNALWFSSMQTMKWKFDQDTVAMTPGPLFHVGGLEAVLLPALVSHGTAVTYVSGGFSVERLLEVCRRQRVSTLLLYSFMLYDLLRLEDPGAHVPPSLGRLVVGGDTLQPWTFDELDKSLPGIDMVQVYGLTEGGPISTCMDREFARDRPGSVGRPMPLSELKVVDERDDLVAPGQVGEVYTRSPAVSPGYWQRPDANAETFRDGWCRTGDLGRIDDGGFLFLAGREKDMIRSGGENIYPAEIEALLTKAPHVADAAVVAVPHPRYNEVGCAVVVPMPGETIDVAALRRLCADNLARFKVPHHFVIADSLPRTPSGKVKKYELQAEHSSLGNG